LAQSDRRGQIGDRAGATSARDETGRKYNKPVWSCEYTDDRRALINGVMRALPKGMGRGTFIWEPTQDGQPLFDNSGGKFVTNAKMAEYPKLAKSYALPVPAGTCH
jgi:hypothetical protein